MNANGTGGPRYLVAEGRTRRSTSLQKQAKAARRKHRYTQEQGKEKI